MNILYYKVGPTGYTVSKDLPPSSADRSKQIPVYRIVNQFMNTEPNDLPSEIPETQSQSLVPSISAQSLNEANHKSTNRVKYLTTNSRINKKSEDINSIQSYEIPPLDLVDAKITEKSLDGIKTSQISTVTLDKYKENSSEANTQNNTVAEQNSKSVLQYELEKERILRRNLQKSYKSLLEKLHQKQSNSQQEVLTEQPTVSKKLVKKHLTMTDRSNNVESQEEGDTSKKRLKKNRKMRKSCCDFAQIENSQQYVEQQEEYNPMQFFQANLQVEKMFQQKMQEDIYSLKMRIDMVEKQLLQRELYVKDCELKILKLESQAQKTVKIGCGVVQPRQSMLNFRQHLHYLFTILIVFLCLALVAKK